MNGHQQFAEDLALYALGALEANDRVMLEKHLEDCASCRRELEALRGDMALLALSAGGARPPARSRQRLMTAIAAEPRRTIQRRRTHWWALMPSLAAAAMAVIAVFFWMKNSDLKEELADLEKVVSTQAFELQRAREIVSTLTATDAMRVTLVAAKTPPQPQGRAIYVRSNASLIFLANNLPPLPTQKAYELWLIPTQGAPIPAGVFKPDAHGSATVMNPPLPQNIEAKAFAITVEPETGSSAPTMPILMMGAGE
jgi:anti-sigma-K factor RskA